MFATQPVRALASGSASASGSIGGADAPTTILVLSTGVSPGAMLVGALVLLGLGVLLVVLYRRKRNNKGK